MWNEIYNQQYYDGYKAGQNSRPMRNRADNSWRLGWYDAQVEKEYDGTLEEDLIGHYEDDY